MQNFIAPFGEAFLHGSPYIKKVEGDSISVVGQNISFRSDEAPRRLAYGTCKVGGLLSFRAVDGAFFNDELQPGGQYLHLFLTTHGHIIDTFIGVYINNELVLMEDINPNVFWGLGKWANKFFLSATQKGTDNQDGNAELVANSELLFPGEWTFDHRQRGCAGIYVILGFDNTLYPEFSLEHLQVEGRWKSDIYDPRDDSTGWSDNAVLCTLNYLCDQRLGLKCSLAEFDMDNVSAAADDCDELVNKKDGGTEKRYTVNGSFDVSKDNGHQKVIDELKSCFAGDIIWSNGKFWFYTGKWRAPTITLTEDDVKGPLKFKAEMTPKDVFNLVSGKHFSIRNRGRETIYPPYSNSFYASEDGEVIEKIIDRPLTPSPSACQRLGKIEMEVARQNWTIEGAFSMRAYTMRPAEVIALSLARFGYVEKYFRIRELKIARRDEEGGFVSECLLNLKEVAATQFDWDDGQENIVDIAPNTNLPSVLTVFPPSGLVLASGTAELYKRVDGSIFSALKVSWTLANDPFVVGSGFYEIQYKKTDAIEWQHHALVRGGVSFTRILDVQDGQHYDVRIQSLNGLLIESAWVQNLNYLVLGKLELPTTPMDFTVQAIATGFLMKWSEIADIDLSVYQIDIIGGAVIFKGRGDSFLYPPQLAGNYSFRLKAKDTSGNFSDGLVQDVTVTAPGKPTIIDHLVIHNLVRIAWTPPTTTTFPVLYYKLYKGDDIGSAEFLGRVDGTFKTFHEQVGGTFNYLVTAVDPAGNEGEADNVTLVVSDPENFILRADYLLGLADVDSITNALFDEDGSLLAPVITGQTYNTRRVLDANPTPADKIAAGYPIWIQPANTSNAVIVFEIDLGADFAGNLINLSDLPVWVDGGGVITRTISYKPAAGSYTDVVGQQAFAPLARYIKATYEVDGTDDTSILQLTQMRLRLVVQNKTETGVATSNSSDVGGTPVTFTLPFLDVDADNIVVTPVGSGNARIADYVFTDIPNPTTLYLFLFNAAGTRITGDVRYSVPGTISQ